MYTWNRNSFGLSSLYIVYALGDFGHRAGTRGIPHLMEHLMCKSFEDMQPKLKSLGIDWNAYTSDSKVVFYWEGLSENLESVMQELHNRLTNGQILWSEDKFNNERSTVIQEYKDKFNNQTAGTYINNRRRYYNCTGAIGILSDIESCSYEDSIKHAEFFRIPSKIVQSGMNKKLEYDYDFILRDSVDYVFVQESTLPIDSVPVEDKTVISMVSTKVIPKDKLVLGYLVTYCLGNGLESPLYQEIRDKRGLSYNIACQQCTTANSGFVYVTMSTTHDHVEESKTVLGDFFGGDIGRHISEQRLLECQQSLDIRSKKADILIHEGITRTTIDDYDECGCLGYTIQDVRDFANEFLHDMIIQEN